MGSAKVIIREQDRSAIVPSMPGSYGAITIVCNKGPIGKPVLITSENELIDIFGEPVPEYGVSHYSAITYLSQSNKLWVMRAAHEDIRFSGALVRSKIDLIPQGVPTASYVADSIIKPIAGLTQEDLDSFSFPTYFTNREYALNEINQVELDVNDSQVIRMTTTEGLSIGSRLSFTAVNTLSELNDRQDNVGENTPLYEVIDVYEEKLVYDKIQLGNPQDVSIGDVLTRADGSSFNPAYANPVVVRDAVGTTEVLVTNADYITPNEDIKVGTISNTFLQKDQYKEDAHFIKVDNYITIAAQTPVYDLVQYELEDRDAFLVTTNSQGKWGDDISVGISPSKDYVEEGGFYILVYFKGVQVESWLVSRKNVLDGFGRQMYLEDKINGKSAYISVKDNPFDVDSEEVPEVPLNTDYSLWRQNPDDLFVTTATNIIENLLAGHSEVKVSDTTPYFLGMRIKFEINNVEPKLSSEYKVQIINSSEGYIKLDRVIEEDQIDKEWLDVDGNPFPTRVFFWDETQNDSLAGIVDGIQYYQLSKVDKVFYNYPINSDFVIGGIDGKLIDAGVNMLRGGDNGSPVTVGDLITAVKLVENKEEYPVTILMDGGFATPAYAQALVEVAQKQNLTHCFISIDPVAEESFDYKGAIVDYKASTMLNTEKASIFAGWVKIYDDYNQKEIWVAPDGFAAASQEYTTRNYRIFYPAAGWKRGKLTGALDVKVRFSEGDRDWLVNNRINPIRYKKGSGLVIWGNETTLVRPSPMQLRSVAFLLIYIKYGLEDMLEYITFDLNNRRTWSLVEGALNGFMRDEVKAKDGVYDYSIAVEEVITDSDIDNRRMPVFLGIQPTMDIKEIPVTLAIFNKSVDIDVSL